MTDLCTQGTFYKWLQLIQGADMRDPQRQSENTLRPIYSRYDARCPPRWFHPTLPDTHQVFQQMHRRHRQQRCRPRVSSQPFPCVPLPVALTIGRPPRRGESRFILSVCVSGAEAALRSLVLILPLIFGAAPLQQRKLLDRTWLLKKREKQR